jgi:multisubunit Na+/H+ antiporter MnhC subunit
VEAYLAVVVGAMFAGGFYLVMQRNLLRFVFGLILLERGEPAHLHGRPDDARRAADHPRRRLGAGR